MIDLNYGDNRQNFKETLEYARIVVEKKLKASEGFETVDWLDHVDVGQFIARIDELEAQVKA